MQPPQSTRLVPAVPGSMIIWYNHCHDSTQSVPLLFWAVMETESDIAVPWCLDIMHGQATPFDLPSMEYAQEDPRHGCESRIIAYVIPGWGRIQADRESPVYGEYPNQVSGYDSGMVPTPTVPNPNARRKMPQKKLGGSH